MVSGWGSPPDTQKVLTEISNLHMWCGIYTRGQTETGIAYPESIYWSNLPAHIFLEEFYSWTVSSDFEELYKLDIPLEVFFGDINSLPVTVVDNGDYLFYIVIDYIPPSEWYNLVFAVILAFLFFIALYLFIRRYLKPVDLMKKRIDSLETGDLRSSIEIIGDDELADLSHSMNKLIIEIDKLLENKHQLLLEVSHELRSPLARMQLLLEMLPEHKNITKLKEEVGFLEGMIDNLLLSDRLSMPYSKLSMKTFSTSEIINKVLNMFPTHQKMILVKNNIPDNLIKVDETKFILALRNLVDNALKYSNNNQKIEITVRQNKNTEFHVKDFGIGISHENINRLTQPFYQANQTVSTKGFGLGLTISKKIIESHKGHLTISSIKGEGSTFTLHLPIIKT